MSLFCSSGAHIDQEIAATDQIELRERRVLDEIVLGKNEHVADGLVDAIGAAIRMLLIEKVGQPLWRNVGDDAGGVNTGARMVDGFAVDIGGEDLAP